MCLSSYSKGFFGKRCSLGYLQRQRHDALHLFFKTPKPPPSSEWMGGGHRWELRSPKCWPLLKLGTGTWRLILYSVYFYACWKSGIIKCEKPEWLDQMKPLFFPIVTRVSHQRYFFITYFKSTDFFTELLPRATWSRMQFLPLRSSPLGGEERPTFVKGK